MALEDPADEEFMIGFDEWIHNRFRQSTTAGWDRIIAHFSEDDFAALTHSLDLFAEYAATERHDAHGDADRVIVSLRRTSRTPEREIPKMTTIDLLDRIRALPGMYIGQRSIHCLKAFLDGWRLASMTNQRKTS